MAHTSLCAQMIFT